MTDLLLTGKHAIICGAGRAEVAVLDATCGLVAG